MARWYGATVPIHAWDEDHGERRRDIMMGMEMAMRPLRIVFVRVIVGPARYRSRRNVVDPTQKSLYSYILLSREIHFVHSP